MQTLPKKLENVKSEAAFGLDAYLVADLPSAADIYPYLLRIDEKRWYTNFGPLVCELENRILKLLKKSNPAELYGTTLASCYHALETGLHILNVNGGKVLVPSITFPACPLAVRHAGAEPVFADVDPDLWVLTPKIARAIAEYTPLAAVMPVAIYGIPLDIEGWNSFSRDTGIPVIIDAAAAFETQELPEHGLVACSMHATKPFGAGEGGLLLSRNADHISRARIHSNFGTVMRIAQTDGGNAKLSEYHAAVGLAQLDRWSGIKEKRRALLANYRMHLDDLTGQAELHPLIDEAVVGLCMLRGEGDLPANIIERAKEKGMLLHRTYLPPLYRHPNFESVPVASADGRVLSDGAMNKKATHMANSEMLAKRLIGVPFHPFLEMEDAERAVDILGDLLSA